MSKHLRYTIFGIIALAVAAASQLLVSIGNGGSALAASLSVTQGTSVIHLPMVVKSSGQNQPGALPAISAFTANPASITAGSSSTLSWNVSGATSISIAPEIGTVTGISGSIQVQPATTTEYTLTVTNSVGTATARATITVSEGSGNGGEGSFFPTRSPSTHSADIATDAHGGIHAAYSTWAGTEGTWYGYCDGSSQPCEREDAWSFTEIPGDIAVVQLALDPQGRPRLLMTSVDQNFYYAECNAGCINAGNWDVELVVALGTTGAFNEYDNSHHYFALDPQGRPRFVYGDHRNSAGEHRGVWYAFCNANCTDQSQWREVMLYESYVEQVALAFTSAGQPRMLAKMDFGWDSWLVYWSCDANCDVSGANWTYTALYPRGHSSTKATWNLVLNDDGNPRAAFYQGGFYNGSILDETQGMTLYYIWCDGDCTVAQNWNGRGVGLARRNGEDAVLALDNVERPRIAFRYYGDEGIGLGYAWCDVNCESENGQWQAGMVENSNVLDQDFHIPPHDYCTTSSWLGGYRPSLALDPARNPRIAYDNQHYNDGDIPGDGHTCYFKENYRAVRLAQFNQP